MCPELLGEAGKGRSHDPKANRVPFVQARQPGGDLRMGRLVQRVHVQLGARQAFHMLGRPAGRRLVGRAFEVHHLYGSPGGGVLENGGPQHARIREVMQ